jgi:hypothetical protein
MPKEQTKADYSNVGVSRIRIWINMNKEWIIRSKELELKKNKKVKTVRSEQK